jgi:hypothetical protein
MQNVTALHVIALVCSQSNNYTSDNVSYEPNRAITLRSGDDFRKPRALTLKSDNFSPQCCIMP